MTIVRKTISEAKVEGGFDFILSDASTDRYGDSILTEGWDLTNFKKNPVALFAHRADFPIGKWKNLRVSDGALRGSLELAPAKTSPRIDEIRKLIDADVLRAVSVGFRPISYRQRDDSDYGFVYEKSELMEVSVVA